MDADGPEPHLIFNRDLRAAHVPALAAGRLELPDDGGHAAAWAEIWRFGRTFDLPAYSAARDVGENGEDLLAKARTSAKASSLAAMGVWELRGALGELTAREVGTAEDAHLVDEILDALYQRLGGGNRPLDGDLGPYEPPLGLMSPGSGQKRFWFVTPTPVDREHLFDQVEDLLLREAGDKLRVSSLYLYPPRYWDDRDALPKNVFMVLLEPREPSAFSEWDMEMQYERLTALAISLLADPSRDHHPALAS